jgi:hypothetical protein
LSAEVDGSSDGAGEAGISAGAVDGAGAVSVAAGGVAGAVGAGASCAMAAVDSIRDATMNEVLFMINPR